MVRHAKSSWEYDVIDHQRPLKGRGNRDATLVSKYVANLVPKPDKIITSDANRALSTAEYFKHEMKVSDEDFRTNHDLYDFGGRNVMETIKGLDDAWDRVMIVGHNHAFTSIANMLGSKYIDNLPTCGFVMIEFNDDRWQDVSNGQTVKTVFPRDLK